VGKKKKKQKAPTGLEAVLERIRETYGEGAVMKASEATVLDIRRIPTGIFALDYATGGGIPIGRITGIFGRKSSGKTTLALKLIARAQRFCRECLWPLPCKCGDKDRPMRVVWVDAEGVFDRDWALRMGVILDSLYVAKPEYAQQAGDIVDALLRSGDVDFMVLDSVAALTPSEEVEITMDKSQMALQARLVNKMLRKWVSAINSFGLDSEWAPTLALLNQVRMNIGMYGSPEVRPGGMGQEFASSVDIHLRSPKYNLEEDTKEPLNAVIPFTIDKNKTAPPKRHGEFRLWLRNAEGHQAGDTDEIPVIVRNAENYGIIEHDKVWKFGDQKWKTRKACMQALAQDPVLFEQLRSTLLKVMLEGGGQ